MIFRMFLKCYVVIRYVVILKLAFSTKARSRLSRKLTKSSGLPIAFELRIDRLLINKYFLLCFV